MSCFRELIIDNIKVRIVKIKICEDDRLSWLRRKTVWTIYGLKKQN
jgi:hypothetical protein